MLNKCMYDSAREDETAIVAAIERMAGDRGASMAEVALAWLLQKEPITAPIVGVSRESHMEDALRASELELSVDEVAALEEPYRPHPVRGFQ